MDDERFIQFETFMVGGVNISPAPGQGGPPRPTTIPWFAKPLTIVARFGNRNEVY